MPEKVLYVSILWHMHQPYYWDLVENKFALPWVRLHAVKDYYDMVAYLDKFPRIFLNFNLVPSLIDQIVGYTEKNVTDSFMEITLKPASQLTAEEKVFILQNFFMANWENMIKPLPRYWELLSKRGRSARQEDLVEIQRRFTNRDFLDLQVLFNLSWIDPLLRRDDPELREMERKGRGFSEQEKRLVINKQLEIMRKVIDEYRKKQEEGRIEISVSPYYHPILPLIISTSSAKRCTPEIALPREEFSYPEDARAQVEMAVHCYQNYFGRKPKGMWPSEGAVSEEIVPLISQAGIEWIATDEDILGLSIDSSPHNGDILYKPYQFVKAGSSVKILFRNRKLSDLIGFTYGQVAAQEAVNHFMQELRAIHQKVSPFPGNHIVCVILDGENCWEYYKNDGWDFLFALYQALSDAPFVQTVTISEFLQMYNETPLALPKLWSGSWINHNFNVWIGHPEDNLAWEYLARTRKMLGYFMDSSGDPIDKEKIEKARQEMYAAEGSDWNWWYGDEYASSNSLAFDTLYRKHLMNVYTLLGEKPPEWLHVAISGREKPRPKREPSDFINPILDGIVTSYFEWQGAGQFDISPTVGPMHRRGSILKSFYYGFDLVTLFLRLDTNIELCPETLRDLVIKINFFKSVSQQARIQAVGDSEPRLVLSLFDVLQTERGEEYQKLKDIHTISGNKIIELAIPFSDLKASVGEAVKMAIVVERDGMELERWPTHGTIDVIVPDEDFSSRQWSI